MLRKILLITTFAFTAPAMASDIDYRYLELGYGGSELNITGVSSHGEGLRVAGSWNFDSILVTGEHSFFDHDRSNETTTSKAGVGIYTPLTSSGGNWMADAVFGGGFARFEVSENGADQAHSGWYGQLGLRVKAGLRFESEFTGGYISAGDFNGFEGSAQGIIYLTHQLGAFLRYHVIDLEDDDDNGTVVERDDITLGLRLNF